jgi:hypothetical protein
MSSRVLAAAALLLNAFVFGLSWWPFRALQSQGLHPLWATSMTLGMALVCLVLLRLIAFVVFFFLQ